MNATGNWTEEDPSWINFRLTIQQVFYSSLDPRNLILSNVFDQQKCEQVYDAEAMWVTPESFHCLMIIYSSLIICEYSTFSNTWVLFTMFYGQSGVWATSWSWPPFSAPLRWGRPGMSSSGTSPSLTSVCVLSPCPWPWWVRTFIHFKINLESQMRLTADPSDQFFNEYITDWVWHSIMQSLK